MPAWFTCLNFGLPPHEWRPQSSRCVLRQKQRNDDYLDYCSVFRLLCFLPCNPQTHKASESGWEAQASSPLCSVWLLLRCDSVLPQLPLLQLALRVLTIPLLPDFLDVLPYERGQTFISVLAIEMYSHYYYLEILHVLFFLVEKDHNHEPDCFTPWTQSRWNQAYSGWYSCWSQYDFNEYNLRSKTKQ